MTEAERIAAASDAYRWGWDWAKLGMELHSWMLPHLGTTQWRDAEKGWQDCKVLERSNDTDSQRSADNG